MQGDRDNNERVSLVQLLCQRVMIDYVPPLSFLTFDFDLIKYGYGSFWIAYEITLRMKYELLIFCECNYV